MLVLGRKTNQTIIIDGEIRITVVDIRGGRVRLGIEAPQRIPVLREELIGTAPPAEVEIAPDVRSETGAFAGGRARVAAPAYPL